MKCHITGSLETGREYGTYRIATGREYRTYRNRVYEVPRQGNRERVQD